MQHYLEDEADILGFELLVQGLRIWGIQQKQREYVMLEERKRKSCAFWYHDNMYLEVFVENVDEANEHVSKNL